MELKDLILDGSFKEVFLSMDELYELKRTVCRRDVLPFYPISKVPHRVYSNGEMWLLVIEPEKKGAIGYLYEYLTLIEMNPKLSSLSRYI